MLPSQEPWILTHLAFRADSTADSHSTLMPWSLVAQAEGRVRKASAGLAEGHSKIGQADEGMLQKHPWPRKFLEKRKKKQPAEASTQERQVRNHASPLALSQQSYDQAVEELEAQRRQWQWAHQKPDAEFRRAMLGGTLTKQHVGLAADAIKAEVFIYIVGIWKLSAQTLAIAAC